MYMSHAWEMLVLFHLITTTVFCSECWFASFYTVHRCTNLEASQL